MSYKCQSCKVPQISGTKENKITTEIKNVDYLIKDEYGKIIKVISGFEIAKEKVFCSICANKKINKTIVGKKIIEINRR